MYCPKCSKEIKDGSVFCNYCGNTIASRTIPPVVKKLVIVLGTFFYPGLGHILTGRFKKGIKLIILASITLFIIKVGEELTINFGETIFLVTLPYFIAFGWGLIDAFKTKFE
jgi:hypothetical protein